jgi:hypothetical protein
MRAFNKELQESGVLVSTEGLAFPQEACIAAVLKWPRDGTPDNPRGTTR